MQFITIEQNEILYYIMQYYLMQYCTVEYYTIQYNAMPSNTEVKVNSGYK